MLRATLKSLLSRKLRLILSGLAVVLGRHVRLRRVRAHRHPGPLVRPAVRRRLRRHRRPGRGEAEGAAGELDGERVTATVPASTVDRSAAVPGVAGATGAVVRRRRPADRQQRQGGHLGRAAAARRRTGRRRPTAWSCARAGRPTADNEIAINAGLAKAGGRQGRRPGRRADPGSPSRRSPSSASSATAAAGTPSAASQIGAFTTPVAQRLMLGEPGVFTPSGRQGGRRASPTTSCATGVAARARRRVPGEDRRAARRRARRALAEGAGVLQQHPARLRRGGAVRRRCS